jgi:hypothetical protein
MFIVGNGWGDKESARSNAFQVLYDGRAKVQTAPTETDDIVRLEELTQTNADVDNLKEELNKISDVMLVNSDLDTEFFNSLYK